jgi:hypothetical protein
MAALLADHPDQHPAQHAALAAWQHKLLSTELVPPSIGAILRMGP